MPSTIARRDGHGDVDGEVGRVEGEDGRRRWKDECSEQWVRTDGSIEEDDDRKGERDAKIKEWKLQLQEWLQKERKEERKVKDDARAAKRPAERATKSGGW